MEETRNRNLIYFNSAFVPYSAPSASSAARIPLSRCNKWTAGVLAAPRRSIHYLYSFEARYRSICGTEFQKLFGLHFTFSPGIKCYSGKVCCACRQEPGQDQRQFLSGALLYPPSCCSPGLEFNNDAHEPHLAHLGFNFASRESIPGKSRKNNWSNVN